MITDAHFKKFIYYSLAIFYIAMLAVTFSFSVALSKVASTLIIPPAFLLFLIQADFNRVKVLGQYPLLLIVGIMVVYVLSVAVWIINLEQTMYIITGTQRLALQIINILVVLSAVYIFGSKAVDYSFYAACVMNGIVMIREALRFGLAKSALDFIYALKTGNQQGFMSMVELHVVTYTFGLFIFYYIFASKYPLKKRICYIAVATLFVFTGFKRIIFASIVIGILVGAFLFKVKNKKRFILLISIVLAVCSFAYVYIIRAGIFEHIMTTLNIDTKARVEMYNFVKDTYEFSPTYIGKGFDFVVRYLAYVKTLKIEFVGHTLTYIHNDILVRYIEMGFFPFCGWLYSVCIFLPMWLYKRFGEVCSALYCTANVFCFINYSVGNTNRAYEVRLVFAVIVVGLICAEQFESKEKKKTLKSAEKSV